MTWVETISGAKRYLLALPGIPWVIWEPDPVTALKRLGVYMIALALLPTALAMGRLGARVIDRVAKD